MLLNTFRTGQIIDVLLKTIHLKYKSLYKLNKISLNSTTLHLLQSELVQPMTWLRGVQDIDLTNDGPDHWCSRVWMCWLTKTMYVFVCMCIGSQHCNIWDMFYIHDIYDDHKYPGLGELILHIMSISDRLTFLNHIFHSDFSELTLRSIQNSSHLAESIFKLNFLYGNWSVVKTIHRCLVAWAQLNWTKKLARKMTPISIDLKDECIFVQTTVLF